MIEQQEIALSPTQRAALDGLLSGIPAGDVLVLKGRAGSGRTTILQALHSKIGGELLGMSEFLQTLATHEPMAIEEAFLEMIAQALLRAGTVIVDDLHLVTQVVNSGEYQRSLLLDAALTAILGEAAAARTKLVFALDDEAPWPLRRRAYSCEIGEFAVEDYECIGRTLLGPAAGLLDFAKIHRFAPALTAQQIHNACNWLRREADLDTEVFIEYLRSHDMASNVELEEVQRVSWTDLKGAGDVIRQLEAKVALPFENDALREELKLKPKRGVLLAGPPGTGKTTIGRALAHRLKSKFFLIDGTAVAGSHNFYAKVSRIFEDAKRNAPSIVFIDDADVIFEDGDQNGFYRYLLTILDGLESASAERVCVMMTAMHPGSLPPAMLRSGRIELWLETRLPDESARSAILADRLAEVPATRTVDIDRVAAASHGLTGPTSRT